VKRTLKKRLKALEIVKRETSATGRFVPQVVHSTETVPFVFRRGFRSLRSDAGKPSETHSAAARVGVGPATAEEVRGKVSRPFAGPSVKTPFAVRRASPVQGRKGTPSGGALLRSTPRVGRGRLRVATSAETLGRDGDSSRDPRDADETVSVDPSCNTDQGV